MLARLLREPLLHFLLLGGVLFAIFGRGGPSDAGIADRQIVVSEADIARLADGFSRTWHRPPAADELEAQIHDYIREEVLYRTALALGLDKDDTIIRRRLRQKMEFLFEDTVPVPQEAELRAYLQAHAEKFRTQPLISFRQIFVSQSRGGHAEADARQILARLVSTAAGAASEGDALLLGDDFTRMPLDQVAAQFGESFAQTMAQSVVGRWVGPLRSAYGLHLVLVTAVEPAELPPFEQVRSAVEREWFADAPRRRAGGTVSSSPGRLPGRRAEIPGRIAMKRVFVLFGLLAVLLLPLHGPHAHEVRPGFLELRAIAANVFLMTWKVPALGTFRLGIEPRLPDSCHTVGQPTTMQAGGAFIEYGRVSCTHGLGGQRIAIDRLDAHADRRAGARREHRRQRANRAPDAFCPELHRAGAAGALSWCCVPTLGSALSTSCSASITCCSCCACCCW